jgi:hypothetical protein
MRCGNSHGYPFSSRGRFRLDFAHQIEFRFATLELASLWVDCSCGEDLGLLMNGLKGINITPEQCLPNDLVSSLVTDPDRNAPTSVFNNEVPYGTDN